MQEEVTQRTVALCVEATRLSAGMLQQAMKKVLDEMQKGVTGHKTKLHHGKQTLRQLKATQGDTGHAQASMVTEVYAHILDEERKINAQKFEVAFYANPDMRRVEQELNPPKPEPAPDLNLQSLLAQLQENPELARQLKALLHAG